MDEQKKVHLKFPHPSPLPEGGEGVDGYLYPLIYPYLAWFLMLTASRLYAMVCTRAWMLLTLTGTLPDSPLRE